MDAALFSKYTLTPLTEKRVNPPYEVAKLFVIELNKTAGQPYVTKEGKKGKVSSYSETRVMKDLKKLRIADVHKANGFFEECLKASIGFRFYYCSKLCKVKNQN